LAGVQIISEKVSVSSFIKFVGVYSWMINVGELGNFHFIYNSDAIFISDFTERCPWINKSERKAIMKMSCLLEDLRSIGPVGNSLLPYSLTLIA